MSITVSQQIAEAEKTRQDGIHDCGGRGNCRPVYASRLEASIVETTSSTEWAVYPQIKADTNFMGLQKSLVDTEQRIALARGYFNDIATHYNTRLEIVPERYVAALAAMKPQVLMSANDFQRAAVKVDMDAAAAVT